MLLAVESCALFLYVSLFVRRWLIACAFVCVCLCVVCGCLLLACCRLCLLGFVCVVFA